jgi:hypothetical protein
MVRFAFRHRLLVVSGGRGAGVTGQGGCGGHSPARIAGPADHASSASIGGLTDSRPRRRPHAAIAIVGDAAHYSMLLLPLLAAG